MSQVLTVRAESLATGFAAGDNDTRSAERNRHIPLDERAPDMPFEFVLRLPKNFFLVHRTTLPHLLTSALRSYEREASQLVHFSDRD
jgi:hypothetical protein